MNAHESDAVRARDQAKVHDHNLRAAYGLLLKEIADPVLVGNTFARNTVQRADAVVALAQKIQAASSPADAAPLVTQLVSLTNELLAGKDRDGGLQQCEEHVRLMLAAEP